MNRNWMEKKSPIYQSLTLQGWFLIKLLKFVQKCFSFCLTDQVFWNVGKFHVLKCWKVSYLDGHSMIQTSFLITSHNYYAKHWRNTSSIFHFKDRVTFFPVTDFITWNDLLSFWLILNIIIQWSLRVCIWSSRMIYP